MIIGSGNKVQCMFLKPLRLSTQKMGALIPRCRALHRNLSPLISTWRRWEVLIPSFKIIFLFFKFTFLFSNIFFRIWNHFYRFSSMLNPIFVFSEQKERSNLEQFIYIKPNISIISKNKENLKWPEELASSN